MGTREIVVDEQDWFDDAWKETFLQDRREEGWEMVGADPLPDKPQLTVRFKMIRRT